MSTHNHNLYKGRSQYYEGILNSDGRYLGLEAVKSILADHCFTLREYLEDTDQPFLPDLTDASDLVAWLGY